MGPSCPKCHKTFETQSALNQHERRCKQPDATYVKLAVNGSYSCLVCGKAQKDKELLKKHLFEAHSEVDVMVRYGIPF